MRLLITGDRNWTDAHIIRQALEQKLFYFTRLEPITLIHGAARGADSIAAEIASRLGGFTIEPHPALWERYGRAAGPIRNQEMLDSGVDEVWAFHPDLAKSAGTADMVRRAMKAGVTVLYWDGMSDIPLEMGAWDYPLRER